MRNIVLALAHGLEFIAVALELPSAILTDISGLFYRLYNKMSNPKNYEVR